MPKSYAPKILLTNTLGNNSNDDVDIWMNYFLELVWPKLPNKKEWFILVDTKRPDSFEAKHLPKGLKYHFHGDNPDVTEDWLERAEVIHCLNTDYSKREHIWHWEDKFGTIFVHKYPREIYECIDTEHELKNINIHDSINVDWVDDYLATYKRRIYTGINNSKIFDEHPNYTYNVQNLYKFIANLPLTSHISNGKTGYTATITTPKVFHWLHGINALALVEQKQLKTLREQTTYTMPNLDVYQWHSKSLLHFMNKNWGIFHGAHFCEPFGYDIFQAVDYGKLPILNYDYIPEIEYKYRVKTKNEFDKMIKTIVKDDYNVINSEFTKLKEYMKTYDAEEEWGDKIRTSLLA